MVIGGDAGGMSAAMQARRRQPYLEIVALEKGAWTSYSACGIPYLVGGDVGSLDDLVARTPQELRDQHRIDVRLHHEVVGIDLARAVARGARPRPAPHAASWGSTSSGRDRGPARPVRTCPGIDLDHVIRASRPSTTPRRCSTTPARRTAEQVVVVGGGYIGLEMAEAFVRWGAEVTLVEGGPQLMRTLDRRHGRSPARPHARPWASTSARHRGRRVRARTGAARRRRRARPPTWSCSGLGVTPNAELAADAGADTGARGALVVDRRQRTTPGRRVGGGRLLRVAPPRRRRRHPRRARHRRQQAGAGRGDQPRWRLRHLPRRGRARPSPRSATSRSPAPASPSAEAARHGFEVGGRGRSSPPPSPATCPTPSPMTVKLVGERGTGRLLGGQIVGGERGGQAHRHAGDRAARPDAGRRAHRPRPRLRPAVLQPPGTRSRSARPGAWSISSDGWATASWARPRADLEADRGLVGRAWCRRYSDAVDRWLTGLLARGRRPSAAPSGVALRRGRVATAGPSCRRSPTSTCVLLHDGRADIGDLADRVWYPIWDEGLKLGHAVRTAREALALAADDLDTATSLLQVRHVAGDPRPHRATWPGGRSTSGRSERSAGSRSCRPGSRPATTRRGRWRSSSSPTSRRGGEACATSTPCAGPSRLAACCGRATTRCWTPPTTALLSARVELHRRTGRPGDRLLLEEQDAVAAALGDASADALMHRLSAAARTIAWRSDDAWHRIDASLSGPPGWRSRRDRPIGPGLVLRDGEVHLTADADLQPIPASCCAPPRRPRPAAPRIHRASLDRLAAASRPLPEPWPPEVRDRARRPAARRPPAPSPSIEALDQMRPLGARAPRVGGRAQQAAAQRLPPLHRRPAPDGGGRQRRRPAWLAPTGPTCWWSAPSCTTSARATRATTPRWASSCSATIGPRMGFAARRRGRPPGDGAPPPAAARRRHPARPRRPGHPRAGGRGGRRPAHPRAARRPHRGRQPGHRAGRVGALEGRARPRPRRAAPSHVLAGGAADEVRDDFPTQEHLDLLRSGAPCCAATATGSPSSPPTGRGSSAGSPGCWPCTGSACSTPPSPASTGRALEVLRVESSFGPTIEWDQGRRRPGARPSRAGSPCRPGSPSGLACTPLGRRAAPIHEPPRVVVDNDASRDATVVEVHAPDTIGVLYRITRALAELDLNIVSAKVQTLGERVVDAFYVRDRPAGSSPTPLRSWRSSVPSSTS